MCCGQPPPLLLRDGRAAELDVPEAPPLGLGLGEPPVPERVRVPLRGGDRLFVVTDGVTEARDAAGRFYPLRERLARLAGAQVTPAAAVARVWEDLGRFAARLDDDVTMLLLTPERASRTPPLRADPPGRP
jgi:serine phosphatase RsbU (regulator of sigma subunit)